MLTQTAGYTLVLYIIVELLFLNESFESQNICGRFINKMWQKFVSHGLFLD